MRYLDQLEEGLIVFILGTMTLISFTQVVARYLFNFSFLWALEVVSILFAWLILIGMSYGVRVGAHIGVDAVVRHFSPHWRRYIGMAVALLCVGYSIIFAYGGYIYVSKIYLIGIDLQDLPIKVWIPRVILPLGFGLLAYRFFEVFFQLVRGKDAQLLGDEVQDAMKLQSD